MTEATVKPTGILWRKMAIKMSQPSQVETTKPEAMATPAAVKQNLIEFPLGLTKHKTPAASPLPGHLIAGLGTVGHWTAVALRVLAAVAFAAWVILRPPRDARAVAWRLAVGYTVMFVLDPSTRFGYFAYPLALLGWLALTKPHPSERRMAAPPGEPALVPVD